MATIVVSNAGDDDVYISDLYTAVRAGSSVSTERSVADLSRMAGLHAAIADGLVTVAVTYSAAEKASGLVDQGDVSADQGGSGVADLLVIRKALTAGVAAAGDDVTVFAVNTLPFHKLRILDAYLILSAGNAGGRSVSLYTGASAAGTLCAQVAATAAGRNGQTAVVTATSEITNGASVGLFARRSHDAVAGELFILLRPEV